MPYYYDDRQSGIGGFLNRFPPVTRNILLINIVMYIATVINQNFMVSTFAMFYPASPFFRIWQPITYLFMHGGFWHLFFNMFCLLMFGSALERTIGSKKYLIFYFVAGLGAALTHTVVEYFQMEAMASANSGILSAGQINLLRTPTLGASGAIYGVLLGYGMLFPDSRLTLIFPPVSMKAKWFVIIFAAIELLSSLGTAVGRGDGVAHIAHLGGMLFALVLILFWKKRRKMYEYHD